MRGTYTIRLLLLVVVVTAILPSSGVAFTPRDVAAVQYRIDKEWAVVWIKDDASIDILYNITITYESSALGYLTIGLPDRGFTVASVTNLVGTSLSYDDVSSGSFYGVEVYFGHPMSPGDRDTVLLVATVPNMLFLDEMNPGYVGMQFVPTYFDAWTTNLRVAMVPPQGVTADTIKTSETAFFTTVDGDFAVYWERSNLAPNTKFTFGVSVPEEYVTLPSPGPSIWFYLALLVIVAAVVIVVIAVRRRRMAYEKPKVMIEALGPRRGLTSVEAAVVVGVPPVKVLTMILFGLVLKGLVVIEDVEPLVKARRIDAVTRDGEPVRQRYYEIDFLRVIEPDGSLNERRLARTYLSLRDNVDRKMRGYARADTVNYYKSVVDKAWTQVTQAATPQLQAAAIEENIRWLLVDENYGDKLKTAFPPGFMILPRPSWFWYWYGPSFPQGSTTATPTARPAPSPGDAQPLPVQEFADNLVSGLERATNNIVKDVENFTNRLIPAPRSTQSSEPVRGRSSCVCACAHCACACACVSCACACAGGGAR